MLRQLLSVCSGAIPLLRVSCDMKDQLCGKAGNKYRWNAGNNRFGGGAEHFLYTTDIVLPVAYGVWYITYMFYKEETGQNMPPVVQR